MTKKFIAALAALTVLFLCCFGACSKGTYIRSLANDFGKALNNGACLKTLRRTRIGDFHVEDAWQLEDLKQAIIDSGEEYREWKKQNEISKT